ncbi:MAG: hypothetical protein AAF519_04465 [Bacteroidota bacterium]
MTIRNLVVLAFTGIFISCGDNEVPIDELPPAVFPDIVIDLRLPQYQDLDRDKGFVRLSQGLRGIILYRENINSYHAIEQNCTYLPFEAGSTADIDPNFPTLMRDPFCQSTFALPDVFPSSGPAVLPLRKYRVTLNASILTITSDPIQ